MPGGRAIKPGDVLTGAGGKTVEVINTDAEGRLILGDGLWYAQQLGATHLVDVATLTGACVVALGRAASGLFGQPRRGSTSIRSVGARAGDRCWPMPLYEEYADQLRSEIADMMNTGGRPAGACTAAMFLKEFAGGLPWAHLDIAGTAWVDDAKPWLAKGPTGVAVRRSPSWRSPASDGAEDDDGASATQSGCSASKSIEVRCSHLPAGQSDHRPHPGAAPVESTSIPDILRRRAGLDRRAAPVGAAAGGRAGRGADRIQSCSGPR